MLLYLLLCFVVVRLSEPSYFTTYLVSGLVMVYRPQIRHEEMVVRVDNSQKHDIQVNILCK